ncbi:hypothetical protein [Labrys miyagiensis]|nr:hypothetical protein [Labrys miyagiensis]
MKPMLDISAQPTATRLLVHAVVLLATLVRFAFRSNHQESQRRVETKS